MALTSPPGIRPPEATVASASGSSRRARLASLAAAGVVCAIAISAAAVSWQITGVILDETVHKLSAVYYSTWFPGGVLHDPWARSTSRLYSVLLFPFVKLLPGADAVRAGRALNGALFASAALPAYLLLRTIARAAWAAWGAVLVVAVPWLVLTTALFTENLAYPLFLWAVLAMAEAYRRPTWWRDGLALVAVGLCIATRAQLVALLAAYVLVALLRAAQLRRPRLVLRAYPFVTAIFAVAMLAAVAGLAAGRLHHELSSLAGPYSVGSVDGVRVRLDIVRAAAVETLALSLGTGLVLPVLAAAWYPRALAGRLDERARACALAGALAGGAVAAAALISTGGYIGALTEERYFVYLAPLLVIGGIAALARAELAAPRVVVAMGLILAALLAIVPLPRTIDPESVYFAPAMTAARWLADRLGTAGNASERLLLAAVALGAAALAWRAAANPRGLARAAALATGTALQLILLAVTYAAVLDGISGVPGRTGSDQAERGFVDRATGGAVATWVESQSRNDAAQAMEAARSTLLYNDGVRERLYVPGTGLPPEAFPLSLLRVVGVLDRRTGAVRMVHPRRTSFFVGEPSSPYVQLAGATIARSSLFPLEVVRVDGRPHVRWLTSGIGLAGSVPAGQPVRFTVWGPLEARIRLVAPTPVRIRSRVGGVQRSLTVGPEQGVVAFRACGRERGSLRAQGAARVVGVELGPARC
jgi:hypothetical protein